MARETSGKILLEFDPEKRNLLPALKKISAAFGYVSENNAEKIADYFSVPLSKVYETASFYDRVNLKKQPLLAIKICSGTNCTVGRSVEVIREIENYFKIKAGDEDNPKVRLEVVSCLGQCGEGPIAIINGKIYPNATASCIYGILEEYL